MDPIYFDLRRTARHIVDRFPVPDFYRDFFREYAYAKRVLRTDALLVQLMDHVGDLIENDYGHGLNHALKVAQDSGALILVETDAANTDFPQHLRRVQMTQAASLLHDVRRKEKDHALAGAKAALPVLERFRFSTGEIDVILYAIQSHEAFKPLDTAPAPEAELISSCLYDADKFRWGPDNFTDTVWEMVAFTNPSLSEFLSRFPSGMEKLQRIRSTFRSRTGRRYGPQFIDFGIAIGEELLKIILRDYSHML